MPDLGRANGVDGNCSRQKCAMMAGGCGSARELASNVIARCETNGLTNCVPAVAEFMSFEPSRAAVRDQVGYAGSCRTGAELVPRAFIPIYRAACRAARCATAAARDCLSTGGSAPDLAVQQPVVDRFDQVVLGDLVGCVEVRDRPRHAKHFVVGPGRQAQLMNA